MIGCAGTGASFFGRFEMSLMTNSGERRYYALRQTHVSQWFNVQSLCAGAP
jgi:hypothetical protein